MFGINVAFSLLSLIIILLSSTNIYAKNVYVSDELVIQMRTDKGTAFRIRKGLPSGTRLKVIQTDPSGYTEVETEGGTRGWVLSRFLKDSPIAKDLLKQAQNSVAKYQEEKKNLVDELNALKKRKNTTGKL
jgi:SH3 domain protein